ncbi:hypothetical protein KKB40_02345, partial [Patescibacteria group bacterium]|nr:hypothetical protein [Patescibacteria group bacterium]
GGWSYYQYLQIRKELAYLKTFEGQQTLALSQQDELLKRVGKLIVLPTDEEPTIATIADVDVLSEEQPFFKGASNGDSLIVYSKAQRAIIYSHEKDTLINVGAVYLEQGEGVVAETVEEMQGGVAGESDEIMETGTVKEVSPTVLPTVPPTGTGEVEAGY